MANDLVGMILRVPIEVSETQFIKIVYDARHCPANPNEPYTIKAVLIAKEFDPISQKLCGKSFEITVREAEAWMGIKLPPPQPRQGTQQAEDDALGTGTQSV